MLLLNAGGDQGRLVAQAIRENVTAAAVPTPDGDVHLCASVSSPCSIGTRAQR